MAHFLLLETGDHLLLETGDKALLEDNSGHRGASFPVREVAASNANGAVPIIESTSPDAAQVRLSTDETNSAPVVVVTDVDTTGAVPVVYKW
jgi:hypothetical protein